MDNAAYYATHGTVIDLNFRHELAKGVLATNNRAVLFQTLHTLAKLKECKAICWGLEKSSRSRVFLFIEWKGPAGSRGRPALPLGTLNRLVSEPPHIHDVIFPGSLHSLSSSATMRFRLLMSDATRELPQYTDAALDDKTWQANLRADSHHFSASFPQQCPSPWARHPRMPGMAEDEDAADSLVQELPGFEYLTVRPAPWVMRREAETKGGAVKTSIPTAVESADDWVFV